jgi:hypothetical protein
MPSFSSEFRAFWGSQQVHISGFRFTVGSQEDGFLDPMVLLGFA